MVYGELYRSPLGELLMESDGDCLTALRFDSQQYLRVGHVPTRFLKTDSVHTIEGRTADLKIFNATREWLDQYFSGKIPTFIPPLRLEGTTFQKEVWDLLLQIDYGKTVTYKSLAERIAQKRGMAKMSAQAIGGAVGRNPVGIIVPCHRVIGSDGSLTGYAGGLWRKKWLLDLERKIECDCHTQKIRLE